MVTIKLDVSIIQLYDFNNINRKVHKVSLEKNNVINKVEKYIKK